MDDGIGPFSRVDSVALLPQSPFAAPNSRSTPKFRHSLLFTLLPINPRATLPHGRPRPGPNLEAPSPPARRPAPPPTAHYSALRPLCLPARAGSSLSDLRVALFSVLRCSSEPTLVFALVCRLFVVSLRPFLHPFPLFSIPCSLFSKNTRVGGAAIPISAAHCSVSTTHDPLSPIYL